MKKCVKSPPELASLKEREVLFMYAVIETGGKQYKVNEGDNFKVGAPNVEGAVVSGKVLANGKAKKIYVMKYKSKKNEKKKIGHRQPYTKVQILSIKA